MNRKFYIYIALSLLLTTLVLSCKTSEQKPIDLSDKQQVSKQNALKTNATVASDVVSDVETMTIERAAIVMSNVLPDVEIISLKPFVLDGIFEVTFQSRGEKGVMYLDKTGQYLVVGSIINIQSKANLTKATFDELNKVNFSDIPLDNSLVLGNRDAKHKFIVFDDPD